MIRIFLISFFISITAKADMNGFCGKIDFRRASNETLTTLVLSQDLGSISQNQKVQCGLPGEEYRICSACTNEFPEDSMQILRPILASKDHTDWHAKWHKIRLLDVSMKDDLFQKLQMADLIPQQVSKEEFLKAYKTGGTLAGENFFFMHRMMIKMVQFELAMQGKSCVAPWLDLPESVNDPVWPSIGTDERLTMLKNLVAKFQNPEYLKKVSLNALGGIVEPTLHQHLHEFYRSRGGCTEEAKAQGYCDDLIPVETSPVNKYFWKLHGLMDDLLGRWLAAHGYQEISKNCDGREACYQWRATWVGKYPKLSP